MRNSSYGRIDKRSLRTRIASAVAAVFISVSVFHGCAMPFGKSIGQSNTAVRQFFAMDTMMRIELQGKDAEVAADAAQALIEKYDSLWSALDEKSEISSINISAGSGAIKVTDETFQIIKESLKQAEYTHGAFDPTVGLLLELWGFRKEINHIPSTEQLQIALAGVSWKNVNVDDEDCSVQLADPNTRLDLGGIAKGYATDRLKELLAQYEIDRALINLGGNICVIGEKEDGSAYKVAITDPLDTNQFLGIVYAKDVAVITSGGYERYLEVEGFRYSHIMNPFSGSPSETDLASVSIVSTHGAMGDALSTALMVMGLDQAISFWKNNPDFGVVMCTMSGELYCSSNLRDVFIPENDKEVTYFESA